MNKSKIAVLGAGNGGLAIAGHLASKGFKINLYSPFSSELAPIKKSGGIRLEGKIKSFGRLNLITNQINEAIEDVEIIMVAAPAFAHKQIAKNCAPYLKNNQIIVLNPGRTGGALEFNNTLRRKKIKAKVIIAEAQTLVYACRKISPTEVRIEGIKKRVALAALPATRTKKVIEKLQTLYPQFQPAKNVLETSFDNIGAVFHPAIMLTYVFEIKQKKEFNFYNITKATAKLLEEIDKERLNVARAFGIKLKSASQWLEEAYGVKGKNLYEKIIANKAYKNIKAPKKFDVRQITEDIPCGLVPIVLFAKLAKVNTLFSTAVIEECCYLLKRNFWQEGRNLESLGLSEMSIKKIKRFVNSGRR